MKVIRSFLPVGQGAFYKEMFIFENGDIYNIVYDCGTSTKNTKIEKIIEANFTRGEEIHALFISHFHEDHINGIPYLLRYCNVKNIFFPLITEKDKDYLKIASDINKGNMTKSFLENHYAFINKYVEGKEPPRIYKISMRGEGVYSNIDDNIIKSGENVSSKIFGTEENGLEWEFIPFNFRQEKRIIQLEEALKMTFGQEEVPTVKEIKEAFNDALKKRNVIEAYKCIKGDFNTNSMTLFSGIKKEYPMCKRRIMCKGKCNLSTLHKKAGCLYMGDYDASGKMKWNELKGGYTNYLNYIGCLQIPHHGSRLNYNSELSMLTKEFIISAGQSNHYQHPHKRVVNNLLFEGGNINLVSENPESRVDFQYFI